MATVWRAQLAPVTVIIGALGSGKTEIALNCAFAAARAGQAVTLVDLDTVTPAFRSRQAAASLAAAGVELLAPEGVLAGADLPAVPVRVHDALASRRRAVLIDAGGSPAGARAVASLAGLTGGEGVAWWVVVNPRRPGTAAPRLIAGTVTGLAEVARAGPPEVVANLHVADHEDGAAAVLASAFETVASGAALAGAFTRLCAVRRQLLDRALECLPREVAVLALELFMLPPWETGPGGVFVTGGLGHGQQGRL